jgi:hypothetical protein
MWARSAAREEWVKERTAAMWELRLASSGWEEVVQAGRLTERVCRGLEEDLPGVRGKEIDRPKLGAIAMDLGFFFLLLLDAYGEMVWEETRRSWYICLEELGGKVAWQVVVARVGGGHDPQREVGGGTVWRAQSQNLNARTWIHALLPRCQIREPPMSNRCWTSYHTNSRDDLDTDAATETEIEIDEMRPPQQSDPCVRSCDFVPSALQVGRHQRFLMSSLAGVPLRVAYPSAIANVILYAW